MKLYEKADLHKHGVPRSGGIGTSARVNRKDSENFVEADRMFQMLSGTYQVVSDPAYIADGRGLVATGTLHMGAVRPS